MVEFELPCIDPISNYFFSIFTHIKVTNEKKLISKLTVEKKK